MRSLILFIAFFSAESSACFAPFEVLQQDAMKSENFGFEISVTQDQNCLSCSVLEIVMPEKYESASLSNTSYAVYLKNEVVFKLTSMDSQNSEKPELRVLLNNKAEFSYHFTFTFRADGESCPSNIFVYTHSKR